MDKVISRDGTPIAYQRGGVGAPLVLVHGTGGTHARWAPLLPALEPHYTVYAVDRRGRGESVDTAPYAIEREFEDVAAVVASIEEPANLLGHSFGAICSLEAALRAPALHRLILYEPPIPVGGATINPPGLIDRLEALLAEGEREAMVETFMREAVRMPAAEFERFRASSSWAARVAAAHTLPRELRAQERYHFQAARFQGLATPTLLLLGGESPRFFQAAIEALHAALPHSQVVVLPGQRHVAMDTAPQLFVREVMAFLSEVR